MSKGDTRPVAIRGLVHLLAITFTINSVVYPEKISGSIARLRHNRQNPEATAAATAANFCCGSFVRFTLSLDKEKRIVTDAAFVSSGCGYMLAAAESLVDYVTEKNLTDLHGLTETDLYKQVQINLGEFPLDRHECIAACIESLRSAFADYRTKQVEEFRGEMALVCTCFGVSEETIETLIAKNSLTTVDEVTRECKAGSGCGSCRMLIQEMIDEHEFASPDDSEKPKSVNL